MTAMNNLLLLEDANLTSEFRGAINEEIPRTRSDIDTAMLDLALLTSEPEVDEVSEILKSVFESNQVEVALRVQVQETSEFRLDADGGRISALHLMEEGVNLDKLKGLKTLGLQIGIGISKCLMHLMYFFTHKEEAAESEEKLEIVITDSRFQSFRNSIPELLVSLSWLRKEDDLVSKKLVPLFNIADGQLAGLIGCRRDDKILQLLAKEGLGNCLGQLELLILNILSAFGVPIFAADDSAKLPLAYLQDHLSKLERELRGIELQLSNYKEILWSTDKLAFRNLDRFMRFMDDKIIGLWKDLVGKPPVKAVCGLTTSRGLIEGPFQDFVADATRYLEQCKSTFCTECGEAIGSVFAAKDPDVQQIEYFLHATFVAAKSFSMLRLKHLWSFLRALTEGNSRLLFPKHKR